MTDADLGTVSSVTDAAGQQVSYTHDTMGRTIATRAVCGGQTHLSESTYTHDRLVVLAHNTTQDTIPEAGTPGDTSVRYSFGYDGQYRPTTTSVGSQTLTTNVYNLTPGSLQYGTLTDVMYGNGQSAHYGYDDFKRLRSVRFDDETGAHFHYDHGANGRVMTVQDYSPPGRTFVSETDSAGRPVRC